MHVHRNPPMLFQLLTCDSEVEQPWFYESVYALLLDLQDNSGT